VFDYVIRSERIGFCMSAVHVIATPEPRNGGSYLKDLVAAAAIGECCPAISFSWDDATEHGNRLAAAAHARQPISAKRS
jgi:hypothetical protein